MENSVFVNDVQQVNGNPHYSFSPVSLRHVAYSCGSCGYELNLSSSSRITTTIGSKYGKSIKRGIISFFSIDESRFTQVDEFQCIPYFSRHSWSLFRRKTKLLCRKCGNHIGNAYDDKTSGSALVLDKPDSSSGNEASSYRKYNVRIRALQPSSAQELGTPLFM
ncbi:Chlorophyll A-B binding family protein [Hibiscus syriacus]|uniref:Chlorophyll A-B binding family protein n=1 Tax=Hibiscus syriacus TaxID=106335 RepID=A0A6A2ZRU5_HIBSY|nr:uncharacterized protein At4g08330, chloroplastic-like isoform X1 [Hibiscus syriacus]KAE8694751.1 Chlorophyll A-B binding family protein [Hibiscus syriacus]